MLSQKNINDWKEKGFTIVKNPFEIGLLNSSLDYIKHIHSTHQLNTHDFGSDGILEFPTGAIIDHLSLNENLINAVQILLNTENILLSQCDSWGKSSNDQTCNNCNNDQRMHMDYGNNMFLHPSDWYEPEAVAAIIYLSDVKDTSGGTAVVPRIDENDKLYQQPYLNMPGINKYSFNNDKESAEKYFKDNYTDIYDFRQELYEREIQVQPEFGDILLYRLDLWHRGTPVKKDKIRYVMNLLWKKKECFWINTWNPGFSKKNYKGIIEKIFTDITPLQRSILGIPLPDDPYWTIKKVNQLKDRYPDIDISSYLESLNKRVL